MFERMFLLYQLVMLVFPNRGKILNLGFRIP